MTFRGDFCFWPILWLTNSVEPSPLISLHLLRQILLTSLTIDYCHIVFLWCLSSHNMTKGYCSRSGGRFPLRWWAGEKGNGCELVLDRWLKFLSPRKLMLGTDISVLEWACLSWTGMETTQVKRTFYGNTAPNSLNHGDLEFVSASLLPWLFCLFFIVIIHCFIGSGELGGWEGSLHFSRAIFGNDETGSETCRVGTGSWRVLKKGNQWAGTKHIFHSVLRPKWLR